MHRRSFIAASIFAGLPRLAGATATETPTVLELFTSQGCSSCPPAERLLGQLALRPGLIALAWHVDYWDRLGWRDPFSSPEATRRQQAYARSLGAEVYTPALVVGGARMEVGSDTGAVNAAIATTPPARIGVGLRRTAEGLAGDVASAAQPVSALLVFYLPEETTAIGAGENGGRKLTDHRIVREVHDLGTWDGAPRHFDLPPPPPGHGAVLLVQSVALRILGAAELPA